MGLGEIQVRKGWWVMTLMWLRAVRFCQGCIVVWRGPEYLRDRKLFKDVREIFEIFI